MATRISREELRTLILMAFAEYKIFIEDLEIVAQGSGRWKISPEMLPSQSDPFIKGISDDIEQEFAELYELQGAG
jgi:hypothetical protein